MANPEQALRDLMVVPEFTTGVERDLSEPARRALTQARKALKKPQVYRVCAVCGKRHGVTYGFRSTLTRLGIKGDKAVKECVQRAARERDPKIRERTQQK